MRIAIALPLCALLSVQPLLAQQRDTAPRPAGPPAAPPHHPMMMGQGPGPGPGMGMGMMPMMAQMMGPMHRGMAFGPNHLLEHGDVLGLTAQQASRITQIRDAAKAAHDAAHAEAMQHMQQLGTALAAAAPDTAAARAHFTGHHEAMGRAHWIMLRAAMQAKGVLTEAQRARVDGWADAMQMHQGQGMPMRQGPPRP